MSAEIPFFVVVGNVNQGKSSIVATLVEDSSIPIDRMPGTTTACTTYEFRVEGEPVFRLTDTPGFQLARQALDWMQKRSKSAADHRQAVIDFVETFGDQVEFVDEVQLLRPILAGASILYVVDASSPPQAASEAEMEILRWTGQAGMALINRTKDRDHSAAWRPILQQFFSVVRTFDAQAASFQDRCELLRSFREVREDWRSLMDKTLAALEKEVSARLLRASSVLARLLIDALARTERLRITDDRPTAEHLEELRRKFEDGLREAEQKARREVEAVFGHQGLVSEEAEVQLLATDLFSEESFRFFGLTRTALAKSGAGLGAAVGGTIDACTGGLSFFTGLITGAAIGACAGYFGGAKLASTWNQKSRMAKQLWPGETGTYVGMGPITNPAFAWVLLDRALLHLGHVQARAHARTDRRLTPVRLGDKLGTVGDWSANERAAFDDLFRRIVKAASRGGSTLGLEPELTVLVHESRLRKIAADRAGGIVRP